MLINLPPPYRKGRRKVRVATTNVPPPPPPPPSGGTVAVLGVTRIDDTEIDWYLDAEVAVTAPSANVQILYDGQWITMPFATSFPYDTIAGYVADTSLATQWRVVDDQGGAISPNLIYPQSGTIT